MKRDYDIILPKRMPNFNTDENIHCHEQIHTDFGEKQIEFNGREKHLTEYQPFLFIREQRALERSPMNVLTVGKPLVRVPVLLSIRECTQDSPRDMNVEKPSGRVPVLHSALNLKGHPGAFLSHCLPPRPVVSAFKMPLSNPHYIIVVQDTTLSSVFL